MNKIQVLFLSLLGIRAACGALPVVTPESVTFEQDRQTRQVTISYNLTGAPGIVTLDIQTNGVSIGAQNFVNVTGDVNGKVKTDGDKVIRWDPTVAWPGHTFTDGSIRAVVKAWSLQSPPPYMVVDLTALSPDNIAYYASAEAVPDGVTNETYKTSKLVMRRIEASGETFLMGETSVETPTTDIYNYDAAHLVTLTNDYYLGIYEVTQRQWYNIYVNGGAGGVNNTPSSYNAADRWTHPVENVAWAKIRGDGDNANVCNWPTYGHDVNAGYFLGKFRNKTGILWDLPTCAQWEFACRAGTTGTNNVFGVSLDETAWNANNAATSKEVGTRLPNGWGLYDMLGNVEELCLDRKYGTTPWKTSGEIQIEPVGAAATTGNRVRKGGGFLTGDSTDKEYVYWCRPGATKSDWSQNAANKCMGFRLWCPAVAP